jgi:hypothetical protein
VKEKTDSINIFYVPYTVVIANGFASVFRHDKSHNGYQCPSKTLIPRNTKKETGGPVSEFRLFSGKKKTRFPFVSNGTVSVLVSRDEIKATFSCFELTRVYAVHCQVKNYIPGFVRMH